MPGRRVHGVSGRRVSEEKGEIDGDGVRWEGGYLTGARLSMCP